MTQKNLRLAKTNGHLTVVTLISQENSEINHRGIENELQTSSNTVSKGKEKCNLKPKKWKYKMKMKMILGNVGRKVTNNSIKCM